MKFAYNTTQYDFVPQKGRKGDREKRKKNSAAVSKLSTATDQNGSCFIYSGLFDATAQKGISTIYVKKEKKNRQRKKTQRIWTFFLDCQKKKSTKECIEKQGLEQCETTIASSQSQLLCSENCSFRSDNRRGMTQLSLGCL